jgi:demethoxyubiquinone hydroxylase (CLK1/Coq7/Cat5 family)
VSVFDWAGKPSQIIKKPKRSKPKPRPDQFLFSLSNKQREASILRQRHIGEYLRAQPPGAKHEPN